MRTPALIATFVGILVAANMATSTFGLVTIAGVTATAGTWPRSKGTEPPGNATNTDVVATWARRSWD